MDLSGTALAAAVENFRVQEARYRGGATTILELLDAQISLTQYPLPRNSGVSTVTR